MVANKANILSNELATDAKDDKQRQALKNRFENIYEGDSETAFHEYLTTQTNSWFALFWPQTNGSVANAKYYLAERFGLCEGHADGTHLWLFGHRYTCNRPGPESDHAAEGETCEHHGKPAAKSHGYMSLDPAIVQQLPEEWQSWVAYNIGIQVSHHATLSLCVCVCV